MALVDAWLPLDVFSPEIAFGDRKMPQKITESEFPRSVAPIEFIGRNATRNAHGALANRAEIVEERLHAPDFHGDLAAFPAVIGWKSLAQQRAGTRGGEGGPGIH